MARRRSREGAGTQHRSLAVFKVRSQRFGQIVQTFVLQSHSRPCPAPSRCFSLRDARKRCEGCPGNVCEKIRHVNQSFGARRVGVKAKTPSRCDTLRLGSQGDNLFHLPTRYLNFEVNDFFGHVVLALRQIQSRPRDPDFG